MGNVISKLEKEKNGIGKNGKRKKWNGTFPILLLS
jgi:hypothetical protein